MLKRLLRRLLFRPRRVPCEKCWLVEDCGPFFETGNSAYRPARCPNYWRDDRGWLGLRA